jgi:hypothetical protein
MDENRNIHDDLMRRHRERKEVEWVPFEMRPSQSGFEVEWDDKEMIFVLTVVGLGAMRIRCAVNLRDSVGRPRPVTVSLVPQSGR